MRGHLLGTLGKQRDEEFDPIHFSEVDALFDTLQGPVIILGEITEVHLQVLGLVRSSHCLLVHVRWQEFSKEVLSLLKLPFGQIGACELIVRIENREKLLSPVHMLELVHTLLILGRHFIFHPLVLLLLFYRALGH